VKNKEAIRRALANAILNIAAPMTSSLLAVRLHLDPPKIAALRNGRIAIFSIERLISLATRLGHDVEITVRPRPRVNGRRARDGEVRVVDLGDSRETTII
jgi:predicted XRE-type DNA-binding protein